ncbi:hypothetical protein NCY59_03525 [Acinetobacter radioresistens]|uniref:hypothetical protein n=1 Tax=Acinetobacter radioresistens TaxID=40216 RepID=UPI00202F1972|nr:hypothetical protein [Acinetobacter radioresistens]MCM1934603.1 hypothetical protein [Acinetobacter radioresistens]MCM1952110.1 hypothetical protein [Acinetobacter radioresistens]
MTKHDNVSQGKIMKATEFVKKHGWSETQRIIQDYPSHTHVTSDARMFINEHFCIEEIKHQLVGLVKICELKRLVESHELVKYLGGYERTRARLKMARKNGTTFGADHLRWEKAIADVEACQ